MRKVFVFLVFLLGLAVTGCLGLQQRAVLRRVQFQLQGVRFQNLNLQGVTLALQWKARNPNAVNALLEGFEMDLYANDHHLIHLVHDQRVEIPAHDSTTFAVAVPLTWSALGTTLARAVRQRNLEVRVEGRARVHTPLGVLRIPVIQKTRRIL